MTQRTDRHRTYCQVCGWWSAIWPTKDAAGCAATWHVYEQHPEEWHKIFGDRPPLDPRPEHTYFG